MANKTQVELTCTRELLNLDEVEIVSWDIKEFENIVDVEFICPACGDKHKNTLNLLDG